MRTIASSVSNIKLASAFVSSVLPTPVGPKNKNEPIGRFGSAKPARERRIAFDTATTASSCPTTFSCSFASIESSLSRSPCSIFATGIPVQRERISAISFSPTLLTSKLISCISACEAKSSLRSNSGIRPYCNSLMRCKSPARLATSKSNRACSNSVLITCVPCSDAFSAFHTSSNSLYWLSSCLICA